MSISGPHNAAYREKGPSGKAAFPSSPYPVSHFADYFPLAPAIDYDSWLGGEIFPVGINRNYPKDLLDRVAAGIISYLGFSFASAYRISKNVDRRKREKPKRLDRVFDSLANDILSQTRSYFGKSNCENYKNEANALYSTVNLLRVLGSFEAALTLVQRGYLQEPVVVLRSALEQIAWAYVVGNSTDATASKETPTRCISKLKNFIPGAGLLYGYLSRLSHFEITSHYRFLASGEGTDRAGVLTRSTVYKCYGCILIGTLLAYHQAVCANLAHTKREVDEAAIVDFEKSIKSLKAFSKKVGKIFARDSDIPSLSNYLVSPKLFRSRYKY